MISNFSLDPRDRMSLLKDWSWAGHGFAGVWGPVNLHFKELHVMTAPSKLHSGDLDFKCTNITTSKKKLFCCKNSKFRLVALVPSCNLMKFKMNQIINAVFSFPRENHHGGELMETLTLNYNCTSRRQCNNGVVNLVLIKAVLKATAFIVPPLLFAE